MMYRSVSRCCSRQAAPLGRTARLRFTSLPDMGTFTPDRRMGPGQKGVCAIRVAVTYIQLSFVASVDPFAVLPVFIGITLRGAFGFHLKRLACQVDHGRCQDCILKMACPYSQLFEGVAPVGRSIMRKYSHIPQPFVLVVPAPEVSAQRTPGELRWDLRLFGPAIRFWPYAVHAFEQIGQHGLGASRLRYQLRTVMDALSGRLVWSSADETGVEPRVAPVPEAASVPGTCALRWRFVTPLRLKDGGHIVADRISGLELAVAARRRYAIFQAFYGDLAEDRASTPAVRLEPSQFTTLDAQCRPWNVRRFSRRQGRKMDLDGLIGHTTISGPWAEIGPALAALPVIHLGKATSFGLGRVEWEVA